MEKPTIFISHITEEAELATVFKEQIELSFLGLVRVFQSSDQKSLNIGKNWLNDITEALRNCRAILVFCSPYSVRRPWINFECGAGWARDIEVVPICHSGIRPVDLPVPLSLLQGVQGTDAAALAPIFNMIAEKLGANLPHIDTQAVAKRVSDFSDIYVEEVEVISSLRSILAVSKEFLEVLSKAPPSQVVPIHEVPEHLIERCRTPLEALQAKGHLVFNFSVQGIGFGGGRGGNYGTLTVQIDNKLAKRFPVILKSG